MSILKEFFKFITTDQEKEIELQNEIDLKEAKLEKYAQRFDSKGNIKCDYCNKWVNENLTICSNCGADLF